MKMKCGHRPHSSAWFQTVYLSQDGKLLMSKQVFSRVYVSLGRAHVVHVFYPLAQQRYKDESTMLLLYI